jgi:V-type H+-transporting ATPase subunit D
MFVFSAPPVHTSLIILDINSELDELDREEFYRLKKVSGKKQRDNAAADAEIQAQREREAQKRLTAGEEPEKEKEKENPDAPDVLGEQEDADVIF